VKVCGDADLLQSFPGSQPSSFPPVSHPTLPSWPGLTRLPPELLPLVYASPYPVTGSSARAVAGADGAVLRVLDAALATSVRPAAVINLPTLFIADSFAASDGWCLPPTKQMRPSPEENLLLFGSVPSPFSPPLVPNPWRLGVLEYSLWNFQNSREIPPFKETRLSSV